MVPLTPTILILSVAFLLALLVCAHARRQIFQSGVPDGRLVYQNTDRDLERPLVSPRCGLTWLLMLSALAG